MTTTIPVCERCRGASHCGGEPDFPWHPAADADAALDADDLAAALAALAADAARAKVQP